MDRQDDLLPSRLWLGDVLFTFQRFAMKLYAPMALIGIFLVVTQPMLRAQDSKAEQERAIAEIKKLGGKVEVDTHKPEMPVVGVNLKHTKVVDASLEHLKGLTNLEILYLKDTAVTDDGLVYVKGLTNLEVLEQALAAEKQAIVDYDERLHQAEDFGMSGSR